MIKNTSIFDCRELYDELNQQIVEAAVISECRKIVASYKKRLMALPRRAALMLEGCDANEIESTLEEMIFESLNELGRMGKLTQ